MNFLKKDRLFLAGIILLAVCLGSAAAVQGGTPLKVALVPLQINAPDKLDYLRNGLQDIMASRLAWEGKVVVLDQEPIRTALAKFPGAVDDNRSQEIGKSLGVDYVIFGSLTMVGSGASLDVRVKDLARNQPAEKFYTETKGLDEVIPRVNDLLEDINAKVFERPRTVVAAPAGRGIPGVGTAASGTGEKTGLSLKDFTLRPLSPQIIVNAGGFDLTGIWRSTILPYALVDLAFGDLDGDGYIETVIISNKSVYIYRYRDDKFELIKEIPGVRNDRYVGVDVGDINGTGRPQIFVSNCRNDGLRSLVIAWEGGDYKILARNIPYHLRIHDLPGRGQVLLGEERRVWVGGDQQFSANLPENYVPDVRVLKWEKDRYVAGDKITLRPGMNIYNFVMTDLLRDGSVETVYLNSQNKLVLVSDQGKVEYLSGDYFGGTVNYCDLAKEFNAATDTIMSDLASRTFLPARLIVMDGAKPGAQEVILNKNKDSLVNITARFVSFSSGAVYSLTWDGVTFRENWRTMIINDYIANYGVADFKNNKQKQLVVGVVQSQGYLFFNARSVIYCYDLGLFADGKK